MNATRLDHCHHQSSVDSSCRAARHLHVNSFERSDRPLSVNTSRETEHAIHLDGQEPHRWTASIGAPRLRTDSVSTVNSPLPDSEPSAFPQVTQNDTVVLAGERGTWQVVAPVNGSKADIRRGEGFDTRVVTAVLKNLTVVRCAGSPGCSY